jgi:hypothetical protein
MKDEYDFSNAKRGAVLKCDPIADILNKRYDRGFSESMKIRQIRQQIGRELLERFESKTDNYARMVIREVCKLEDSDE